MGPVHWADSWRCTRNLANPMIERLVEPSYNRNSRVHIVRKGKAHVIDVKGISICRMKHTVRFKLHPNWSAPAKVVTCKWCLKDVRPSVLLMEMLLA